MPTAPRSRPAPAAAILTRLFQHAFAAAKRVRNETRIAERPISVARVAAELAAEIFESLGRQDARCWSAPAR